MEKKENQNILLVHKANHAAAAALGQKIRSWLEAQGHHVMLVESGPLDMAYKSELDLAIILGGDGTMLGVARKLAGRRVPLYGINFGRVGFLTDAQPDQWKERLQLCLDGSLAVRTCMALHWKLIRNGEELSSGVAVNDVVLSRGSLARLVCVNIMVDEFRMGVFRCDGIILCTPVGSSGYSVSAGGSLLYSDLNVVSLTPICPFLNTISPMIFPGKTRFSLCIESSSTDCYITVDGQVGQQLERGDVVEVQGHSDGVLLMGEENSFFDRLRTRGFVLERS